MKWAYGITAVPERFKTTLPQTVESLRDAGFNEPTIFVDGPAPPLFVPGKQVVNRTTRIKAYGNWLLGLWELYIRNPKADRFIMFQDDVVTYQNLREYLEELPYPMGYCNLFTFPHNIQPYSGWYPSCQMGKGACALMFDNHMLRMLLSCPRLVSHLHTPPNNNRPHINKGEQGIDAAVIESIKALGWREYVHNPSLVQHIGDVSTMDHGQFPDANTFRGTRYDAMELLDGQ